VGRKRASAEEFKIGHRSLRVDEALPLRSFRAKRYMRSDEQRCAYAADADTIGL
jgi:hypothetical protein